MNVTSFTPDQSVFDAYGSKLAANDVLLVESISSQTSFILRLAPYDYQLTCTIGYSTAGQYIFAVALARNMQANDTIRFVFIGVNTATNIPFIGSLTYTGIDGATYVTMMNGTKPNRFPCTGWKSSNYRIHLLNQFAFDETDVNNNIDAFVVAVEPGGKFAYAFARGFSVSYNLEANTISTKFGNQTWIDTSFLPHAVDICGNGLIVLAGYVGDVSSKYTPRIGILRWFESNVTIYDRWTYVAPNNRSWQASLTNWDATKYSPKYSMSVRIDENANQILLGIPITNTIVLFSIDATSIRFILPVYTMSNGRAIGMGKSIGWLSENTIAVLVNTYSLNYVWSSSQIFTYDVNTNNTLSIKSIIPNIQQGFAPTFGPILLSIVTTNNGIMMILDSHGNVYILLPSPPGTFTDISIGSVSSFSPCIAGTFSTGFDIQPCTLCPPGSSTQGLTGQYSCSPCSNTSFCPLGSAFENIDLSSPLFINMHHAPAYPLSPQSVRFDNILMFNMFMIRPHMSSHCIVISPFFWALIAIGLGALIACLMLILKHCVTDHRGKKTRQFLKCFFKRTDLLGEGEMWLGGIASFAIVILVLSGYVFSGLYFQRYPIETLNGEATFACDGEMSNAQFRSGLLSLSVSPHDDEVPIFDLLNNQQFILYVHLINTHFDCTDVTLSQVKDVLIQLPILSCDSTNGSLSLSVTLPTHNIKLQILLAGTNTIGGVKLELIGPGAHENNEELKSIYILNDLNFSQVFTFFNHVLAQQTSFNMQLTKIINRTYPLMDEGLTTQRAGWNPYVSADTTEIFNDENEYKYAASSNTIMNFAINEMPFYVFNSQRPIVDEAELIFTNLLFTIVCIEIFGFLFLIAKLIVIPLVNRITSIYRCRTDKEKTLELNYAPSDRSCRL